MCKAPCVRRCGKVIIISVWFTVASLQSMITKIHLRFIIHDRWAAATSCYVLKPPDDRLDLFITCDFSRHAWRNYLISTLNLSLLDFSVSALCLLESNVSLCDFPNLPDLRASIPSDLPFLLSALQQRAVSAWHHAMPLPNDIHWTFILSSDRAKFLRKQVPTLPFFLKKSA